jgi:hypothetical protein
LHFLKICKNFRKTTQDGKIIASVESGKDIIAVIKTTRFSLATSACLLAFVLIVAYLQTVQKDYDWHSQFISELALGEQGGLMLGAFLALALACMFFALALRGEYQNASPVSHFPIAYFLIALPIVAAITFLGAGVVTLHDDAMVHINFVLSSFVAIMMAMFIVLRTGPRLELRLGAIVAIFIIAFALLLDRLQILDSGAVQRLTAIGVLGWMAYVEIYLLFWKKLQT